MRQDQNQHYSELRDGLDVNWYAFLARCGLTPLLLPNTAESIDIYASLKDKLCGVLLTGGNDLIGYGGDCFVRDELELKLLALAKEDQLPVLGVCRGMQLILTQAGAELEKVSGHICSEQEILYEGQLRQVNSYHNWGAVNLPATMLELGRSKDGVLKAVRSKRDTVMGIMWHPERMMPFAEKDINLFKSWFKK